MPKFTNKLGLTEPLYNALQWDEYDPGYADYTPSSLNRPPYMAKLEKEYEDDITVEVADNVWLLLGKATHKIVEIGTANLPNNIAERRIYTKIGKWDISMQMDNLYLDYENQILEDHKTTSVYKFKPNYDGTIPDAPDWDAQLNIGAYILRQKHWYYSGEASSSGNPFKIDVEPIMVKTLRVNGILKDHRKVLARNDKTYPQHPIAVREFQLWSDEKVEAYITEKATAQDFAKANPLENIPVCTDEEMWATPDKFALMKHGRKSAIKLFTSASALKIHADQKELEMGDKKHYIEDRPGERKRCEGYCNLSKNNLCPSYKTFLEGQK